MPADPNPGAFVRRRLDSLSDRVDHPTLARLRLLVSELANRAAARMDPIEVSVTVTAETVRAMVADEADKEEPLPLDWALLLVSRMADRWGVAGGVWFEIDRPRRRFRR